MRSIVLARRWEIPLTYPVLTPLMLEVFSSVEMELRGRQLLRAPHRESYARKSSDGGPFPRKTSSCKMLEQGTL